MRNFAQILEDYNYNGEDAIRGMKEEADLCFEMYKECSEEENLDGFAKKKLLQAYKKLVIAKSVFSMYCHDANLFAEVKEMIENCELLIEITV